MTQNDPNRLIDGIFMLDEWRIEASLNRIKRDGKVINLEPRAMMVLLLLASKPREVFTRPEILTAVWGETIVNDEALTRIISMVRQTLEDDPKNPRFIETIYKKGYRLLVQPREVTPVAQSVTSAKTTDSGRRGRRGLVAAIIMLALMVIIFFQVWRPSPPDTISPATWDQTPLTSMPGGEYLPRISPDGSKVAFVAIDQMGNHIGIQTRQIGSENLVTLPTKQGFPSLMAWSPDGDHLAYVNREEGRSIRMVSLEGQVDRELVQCEFTLTGLHWSPDGKTLLVGMRESSRGQIRIHLVHLDDSSVQRLTGAPRGVGGDYSPRFSPDGQQIAFCRSHRNFHNRVHILTLVDGDTRVLEPHFGRITDLDWSPDGRGIMVASYPEEMGILQRVDLVTEELKTIPIRTSSLEWVSCARGTGRMVVADMDEDMDIIAIDHGDPEQPQMSMVPFNSTWRDKSPQFSPDGERVAFISYRSGQGEIWIAGRESQSPKCLSRFKGPDLVNLRWSGDGKFISVIAITNDSTWTEIFDLKGRSTTISSHSGRDFATGWTADGSGIYIQSDRDGEEKTWLMRPDGSEADMVLPHTGHVLGDRSSTGNPVFLHRRKGGLWERDLSDGAERLLIDPEISQGWFRRHLAGERLYFARYRLDSTILGYYDLETATKHILAELPPMGINWFTMAPDHSEILVGVIQSQGSDLLLLESSEVR